MFRLRRTQHQPGKDVKEDLKKNSFLHSKNINQCESLDERQIYGLPDTCRNKTVTLPVQTHDEYYW